MLTLVGGGERQQRRLTEAILNSFHHRKVPEGKRHCGFSGDHGYDNKITSMQVVMVTSGYQHPRSDLFIFNSTSDDADDDDGDQTYFPFPDYFLGLRTRF